MSDSGAVSRLVRRSSSDMHVEEDGAYADAGCFGWLRGVRDHAVMLQLRKKGGDVRAIGYAWLERMDFDPSMGITLHYAGQRIIIRGSNLNSEYGGALPLYDGLARHRVLWIRELERADAFAGSAAGCIIESIAW